MDVAPVGRRGEGQADWLAAKYESLTRLDNYVDVVLLSAGEGFCGCDRTWDPTLTLSKIGSVSIEWSRALPSEPST